jgi:tetratricopeptide (TPR) repeat protein
VQIFGKKLTILIVKEDGKYRMLDSLEKPNAVGLEMLDRIAAKDLEGTRVLLDWIREQQHLAGGDDPFEGEPFPRFWSKGAAADPVQMKLAAAALLTQSQPTAKQGVAILEEARRSVTDEALKTNIEVALISGYGYLQDYAKVVEFTSDLRKKNPDSKHLFLSESFALRTLGKFDEADTLVQERLKKFPDDVDGLRTLVRNAVACEDYKGAHDLTQKIIDAGKAEPSDMNTMAWQTLFYDTPDGPDIAMAIKAAQASPNSTSILHTLGSLYAAAGKTKEAREVLIQSMDLLYLTEPNPDYWYAFGRIAEQYGENEVARADYARVTKPKQAFMIPDSSYLLAQDRMKLLPLDSQQKVARGKN